MVIYWPQNLAANLRPFGRYYRPFWPTYRPYRPMFTPIGRYYRPYWPMYRPIGRNYRLYGRNYRPVGNLRPLGLQSSCRYLTFGWCFAADYDPQKWQSNFPGGCVNVHLKSVESILRRCIECFDFYWLMNPRNLYSTEQLQRLNGKIC